MRDPLPYHDSLTVTRPGTGAVQDPDTGILTEAAPTAVLSCDCDCIDQRYEVRRKGDGTVILVADAQLFMPLSVDLNVLEDGDRVSVIQRDGPKEITRTGEVADVQVFNARVLVNWT